MSMYFILFIIATAYTYQISHIHFKPWNIDSLQNDIVENYKIRESNIPNSIAYLVSSKTEPDPLNSKDEKKSQVGYLIEKINKAQTRKIRNVPVISKDKNHLDQKKTKSEKWSQVAYLIEKLNKAQTRVSRNVPIISKIKHRLEQMVTKHGRSRPRRHKTRAVGKETCNSHESFCEEFNGGVCQVSTCEQATYTTAVPHRTSQAAAEEQKLLDGISSLSFSRTGPYSLTIEDGDYSDLFAPQLSIHNREIDQLDYGEVIPGPVRIDRTSEKQRSPELASYTTKVPYIYKDVRSTLQAAAEKQKVLDNISPQSSSNAGGDSLNFDDGEYSDLLPILKQQNDIEDLQLGYGEVIENPVRSETTIDKQGVEDLVSSQEPLPTIAAETQTQAIVTTIATEPVSTITAEPITLPKAQTIATEPVSTITAEPITLSKAQTIATEPVSTITAEPITLTKAQTIATEPINTSDIEATALLAMPQLPLVPVNTSDLGNTSLSIEPQIPLGMHYISEPLPTIAIETIAPTVVPSQAPVPTNISIMETPVSPIVPSYAPVLTNITNIDTTAPHTVLPNITVSSVTSSTRLTDLPKEPTTASVPTNKTHIETTAPSIVPQIVSVSPVTSSPQLTDLPLELSKVPDECSSVVSPCVPYNGGVCQAIACIPVETRTYDIFCLEANCFCCMTSLRVSEALPSPAFTTSTAASSIVNVSEAPPSPAFTTSTARSSIVDSNLTTRVPNAINATGSVPITNSGSGTINGSTTTTSAGTVTSGAPDNQTITDQGLTTTNAPAHINATSPGSLQTTGSGAITTIGPGPAVTTTSTPVTPCPNELQGIIKILICMNLKFEENTKCSACPSSLLKPLH